MRRLLMIIALISLALADDKEMTDFLAKHGGLEDRDIVIRSASEQPFFVPYRTPAKYITIYVYPWENKTGDAISETTVRTKLHDGEWIHVAPNAELKNTKAQEYSIKRAK